MSDSIERLYDAVIAAKDLDPATSRTARLFQRGPAKMAKKLAEEAVEVVIDAVSGNSDAVVRESADLLYNLTVLSLALIVVYYFDLAAIFLRTSCVGADSTDRTGKHGGEL